MISTIEYSQLDGEKIHNAFVHNGAFVLTHESPLEDIIHDVLTTIKNKVHKEHELEKSTNGKWVTSYELTNDQTCVVGQGLTQDTVDGPATIVCASVALSQQTKQAYMVPKMATKAMGKVHSEPKTKVEEKDELKWLFNAVDEAVMFFQATSKSGIVFSQLQQRVATGRHSTITLDQFGKILSVYPGSFTIIPTPGVKDHFKVCAPTNSSQLATRRAKFASLIADVTLPIQPASIPAFTTTSTSTSTSTSTKRPLSSLAEERANCLRKKPCLEKSVSSTNTANNSLLDRIKAKQKQKLAEDPTAKYNKFISAHLKRVTNVLLLMQNKSYSLDHMLKILRDSMPDKSLSKKESTDALKQICTKVPEFCQLVSLGNNVQAIKISTGWTVSKISQFI